MSGGHPNPASRGVWSMHVHLPAHPETLRAARKLVSAAARVAGASERIAFELEVATGEALANAFLHAYGRDPTGRIDITLSPEDSAFAVTVRDNGKPLPRHRRPRIPDSVPVTQAAGRGLYLIDHLMDQVEIIHPEQENGGTAVRMIKRVSTA